ncbi:MAG TPA: transglycosylase family protein [Streptosporangiaceae bacterium]
MSAAPAGAATAQTTSVEHATASDQAQHAGTEPQLLASIREAAAQKPAAKTATTKYTVKSGDSLSAIAKHVYSESAAWPVIYYANRGQIKWANVISAGQKLTIPAKPAKIPAAPSQLGPVVPAPVHTSTASTATESAPVTQSAPAEAAPTEAAPTQAAPAQPAATYNGGSGFQSCVISRESGGNSQVMNSSGHYGLYQFSQGTWEAYGGSSADFGHASVSEQNQVFNNAIAQGGQSNWSAYDGC